MFRSRPIPRSIQQPSPQSSLSEISFFHSRKNPQQLHRTETLVQFYTTNHPYETQAPLSDPLEEENSYLLTLSLAL